MNNQAINGLIRDIEMKIDYWCQESDLTYIEIMGVLEAVKYDMINDAYYTGDDDGDDV